MRVQILWIILTLGFISTVSAADSRDALIDAHVTTGEKVNSKQDKTLNDGRAYVYKVDGDAVLVKQGSPIEVAVKSGDVIKVGDTVYTEKGSAVSIAFDYLKKNAIHIPESSRAIFSSIEPNDIKLESGAIFNAVDGLMDGSTWKVTTPVAVAAVRGTVYLVRFETATGEFYAATVDVPDDGKTSAIEIQLIDKDGTANVPEGKEITLREGETPSSEMVQNLSPEAVAEIQQFFEQLKNERESIEENIEQQTADVAEGEMSKEESGENSDSEESLGDDGTSGGGDESVGEEKGDENSEDISGFDDFDSGPGGMEQIESTEPPTGDNMPEFDSGEDFKDEFGQEKLEDDLDEQDYKSCTGTHCSP